MSILLQLNEELSKKAQKDLMKEWREKSSELTLLADLVKKMGARVSEIEKQLMPIVREAEGQKEVIDNAILEYKISTGKTTVSYSELWKEALKIVNDDQKAVLEAFKLSITKVGEGSESLKIVDPKMQKALAEWNKDMSIDEVKALVKKIVKLPNENNLQEGSVLEVIKTALRNIVEAFRPVIQAQRAAKASALKLQQLSKQAA